MSLNTNSVHEGTSQAKGTEVRDLSAFRLKQIKFENYRCFERLTLDLHPNLTVIVGTNGAGKTAILDGIATALAPAVNWLSSANQRLGNELPTDDEQLEKTDPTGIEDKDFRITRWGEGRKREFTKRAEIARIAIETTSGLKWDTWQASIKGKKPAQEIGQQVLHQELLRIQDSFGTEARDYLPVFAYYGVGRGNFTLPQRLRDNELNYSYPTTALHQSLNAVTDMRELLVWFDSEEAAELRQNRYVEGNDFDPSPILQTVRSALESLLGKAYRNPRINKERKLVVDAEQGPSPLLVNQLSQGYQSMLALAMDYARRQGIANVELFERNADTAKLYDHDFQPIKQQPFLQKINLENLECEPLQYTPGVVLIDEVDLHLHPQWQQRVLTDLLKTFPLTQFIVTTHSPQVLSTVPAECIRMIRNDEAGINVTTPSFSPLAHEAGDALTRILGTHKTPDLPLLDDIRRYELMVRKNQESSPEAQTLLAKLEQAGYQVHDSDLATWRFLAQRQHNKEG
ncbi:MAG: AAA family ATPase [Marinospirillum sp.]|uniref:AAA family ATPase n=1 Tax=Marinospirillum sp. TaxID=2183934 RepID=UPI0019D944EA|nr:AAA family ATPase [Marinospirillum sp.]MBE0507867.1 AAA family ATPase [Marinospirillum sp.]